MIFEPELQSYLIAGFVMEEVTQKPSVNLSEFSVVLRVIFK